MYSGDEVHGDEITSGPATDEAAIAQDQADRLAGGVDAPKRGPVVAAFAIRVELHDDGGYPGARRIPSADEMREWLGQVLYDETLFYWTEIAVTAEEVAR